MNNIENLLYSLLPLILIILFSWLFSFLGSKLKKGAPEEKTPDAKDTLYGLMDLLTKDKEAGPAGQTSKSTTDDRPFQSDAGKLGSIAPSGQAPVTPKPIEPRWWGA